MPTQHGATKDFKYVIRPDGTIRVSTKGPVNVEDDELLHTSPQRYTPASDWFWDFTSSSMKECTEGEKVTRNNAATAARDAAASARRDKIERIKELLPHQTIEVQELFELMGELTGFDFTT